MPFLAQEHMDIPGQDLISWYFKNNPEIKDRDAPIYIDAGDPSRYYSHRTAELAIRKISNGLKENGLKQGDCVCLHSFNDINYPILVNGVVACGLTFCGTNPGYLPYELVHAAKAASIRFFIVEPEILENVLIAAKEVGLSQDRILIFDNLPGQTVPKGFKSWRSLFDHGVGELNGWDDVSRSKTTTAGRFFSSGTTGLPKAAKLSHYNFIAQHVIVNDYRKKDYTQRRLMPLPIFHVAAAPSVHFSPLRNGVQLYLMRRYELKAHLAAVARFKITDMPLVPPLVIAIIMNADLTRDPAYSLQSVVRATCGAAPLEKGPQARLKALLNPKATFNQMWGMTETTCIASMFPYPEADQTGSVGRFLPGLDVKLVDDDGNDVTDYDVHAELCIRGPTVIQGYLDEKANALSWDRDGFFHTGDVAYCAKGTGLWYIVDRKKELIKVRGFQVAPPELEAVLLSHPQITDAAVIGVPAKAVTGNEADAGSEFPRGYVVRRTKELTAEAVKAYMAERLAKYKRLDGGVVFLDVVPRNPSGKILKKVLREQSTKELRQESQGSPAKL